MTQTGLTGTGGESVALLGVEVRAEVVAGHACAVVRQRYRNDALKPIEAVYVFPLPTGAAVTGFSMAVAGRTMVGEVHAKEDAFRRYDEAVAAGHGGALLEQERPNVFTANVGNLLPGEETIVEIQYVQPVTADEGAVRWSVPSLVAPRYISARVPDAERVSPPMGPATYGLVLDLVFDLGTAVDVVSPSHAIVATEEGSKTRVRFAQQDVALDRDVVVTASARTPALATAPIASAVCHRKNGRGVLALSLVPDLGRSSRRTGQEVVFVLDRSGSMGGQSMPEARTALQLCLRQLHEGDRFAILAFDDTFEAFAPELVPFGPSTLQRADAWLATVEARGGTELLAPMLEACRLARDGVIVLLTDGSVADEEAIATAFMAARGTARVYSFGIGTNVSDALLVALADQTGGAVERIHPGERIDEKVVTQFTRATASRVTDVTIKTRGIELAELAPAAPRPLVDGEPYAFFATYAEPGRGAIEIRGKHDGESFYLEVPVDLEAASDRPALEKLWAQARIREMESAPELGSRRAESMKARIVDLAKAHGVSSKHTSFVVVEQRTGDPRVSGQPERRVVPVNAPAGWAQPYDASCTRAGTMMRASRSMSYPPSVRMMAPTAMRSVPRPACGMPAPAPPPMSPPPRSMGAMASLSRPMPGASGGRGSGLDLLACQGASGLWEESVAATTEALLSLLRLGFSTSHPVHGAQIKKALEALLGHIGVAKVDVRQRELALGVAWLLASGRRTRQAVEDAARGSTLALAFGNEQAVRAHVEHLAP